MMDLLMLGIIPGTNIQISFTDWLCISAGLSACLCAGVMVRQRRPLARLVMRNSRLLRRTLLLAVTRIQLARQLRKTATVL